MQQLCMFIKGSTPSVPPGQGQIHPRVGLQPGPSWTGMMMTVYRRTVKETDDMCNWDLSFKMKKKKNKNISVLIPSQIHKYRLYIYQTACVSYLGFNMTYM